jgi:hypothetical protein
MALAPHLRMMVWPHKFRSPSTKEVRQDRQPHRVPTDLIHLYPHGRGDEAIMANYFPIALTGMVQSWLTILPKGTLDSWSELYHQFTVNFESAYARPGSETDLHAVQQRSGESLHSFIQQFSHVHNTIPRISNASVVVAFHQGVRDEKILEKLTAHDIQDVSTLFSLADKCARATEGRAWHSSTAPAGKEESKPNAGTMAQSGDGKNNNKKKAGGNQSLTGAATTAVAAVVAGGGRGGQRGDKRPRQSSNSDEGGLKCLVHNSTCHTVLECREIKKRLEQFHEKMQQQPRQDGMPSRQWEGK